MKRWKKVTALVLLSVVILSILNFSMAVHPFRFHSDETPGDRGYDYEDVRFETEDGITLAGWYVPAAKVTDRVVVIGHGYPMDKGDVLGSTLFLQQHFNLLYYDHRYFGESEGRVTTVGLLEPLDIRAALDFLEERGHDRVAGLGFSLSASVMLMTEDDRMQALIAQAPYARLDKMVEEQYKFLIGPLKWPFTALTALYARVLFGTWPTDVSPMDAARDTQRPTLVIHGTRDTVIPYTHALMIMSEASDTVEHWQIPDGGHGGFSSREDDFTDRIVDFFETHLGPP